MILLRVLKGVTRLDSGKDMSTHVSTCIIYDFNVLTAVVWSYGADKTCIFVRIVAKKWVIGF
jgi:hypothetical protein